MRGQWFWQPDKAWVNDINTTNLRTLNAIRMSLFLVTIGGVVFLWASWHAVPHCKVEPCPESLSTLRSIDFAKALLDSLLLFVGAMAGIAGGVQIGKRMTDTEYVERKERAKASRPVVMQSEPPKAEQQVNVNVAQPPNGE